MSVKEVEAELRKQLEKHGIDPEEFDRVSPLPLSELASEVAERDVTIVEQEDKLIVCRTSARITIRVPRLHYIYREIARIYPSGKVVKTKKYFTLSETRKIGQGPERPGEDLLDTAVRCLREEAGLVVEPEDLWFAFPKDERGHPFSLGPSSAYKGLYSSTMWQDFELDLWDPPWPERVRTIQDVNKKMRIKRFSY